MSCSCTCQQANSANAAIQQNTRLKFCTTIRFKSNEGFCTAKLTFQCSCMSTYRSSRTWSLPFTRFLWCVYTTRYLMLTFIYHNEPDVIVCIVELLGRASADRHREIPTPLWVVWNSGIKRQAGRLLLSIQTSCVPLFQCRAAGWL
jgi:hypothetical protein